MPRFPHLLIATASACLALASAVAQSSGAPTPQQQPNASPLPDAPATSSAAPTVFPHPAASRYLVSGQANIIFQAHAPFHSPYHGANSLLQPRRIQNLPPRHPLPRPPAPPQPPLQHRRHLRPRVLRRPRHLRSPRPRRLHQPRRRPQPHARLRPYIARVQLHQTIGLSRKLVDADAHPVLARHQAPRAPPRAPRRQA